MMVAGRGGAAYGLLLDTYAPEWRRDLSPDANLAELLSAALSKQPTAIPQSAGDPQLAGVPQSTDDPQPAGDPQSAGHPHSGDPESAGDLEALARSRFAAYEGERVVAQERRREARRAEQEARDRARYETGPVLSIPFGPDMRYSFDPRGIRPLAELGTVYEPASISDAWGVLEAEGGVLFARTPGDREEAQVPAPAHTTGSTLTGDGWTLELKAGWHVVPGAREGDFRIARIP